MTFQRMNFIPSSEGFVVHGPTGRKISFGELAVAASKLDVPAEPPLKGKENYAIIGKGIQRIDVYDKVNGRAVFGMDVALEGMLCGCCSTSLFRGKTGLFRFKKCGRHRRRRIRPSP